MLFPNFPLKFGENWVGGTLIQASALIQHIYVVSESIMYLKETYLDVASEFHTRILGSRS